MSFLNGWVDMLLGVLELSAVLAWYTQFSQLYFCNLNYKFILLVTLIYIWYFSYMHQVLAKLVFLSCLTICTLEYSNYNVLFPMMDSWFCLFNCACHHPRGLSHYTSLVQLSITVVCLGDSVLGTVGLDHLVKTFWAAILLICACQQ